MTAYDSIYDFVANFFINQGMKVEIMYDVKSIDMQREGGNVVIWLDDATQEYIGFGNEFITTYIVSGSAWIFVSSYTQLGNGGNINLDEIISAIHKPIQSYTNVGDVYGNEKIISIRITEEQNRQDERRGILQYDFTFNVQTYSKIT